MISEAQKKAVKKYTDKFVNICFRATPEDAEIIKKHAESKGESLSAFLKRAVKETIDRDNKKAGK